MQHAARVLILTLCMVFGLAASVLATPESDFREAMTAARAGNMDKAIAGFTKVIEAGTSIAASDLANAYNLRGVCHEAKKDLQQALADYTKAIETDSHSAEALGNRAMLYAKMGDKEKAKADAVAARRIDYRVKIPDVN